MKKGKRRFHINITITNLEGVVSEMSKIAVTSLGLSFLICDMVLVGRKNKTELTQFLSYSMFFINAYSLPSKSRSLQVSILGERAEPSS